MNCKNKLDNLKRRPSSDFSLLPLFSMSASLSMRSTISRVKLQSNSLTVHFVWSKTSSLSSTLKNGSLKPLFKSISSFALVENGVCTSVNLPSDLFHSFGSLIALKKLDIFSVLFLPWAVILSLSIYWRILVSLLSNYFKARAFSSSLRSLELFIFLVSLSRHASSSLYKMSKSFDFFGCILLYISTCLFESSSRLSSSYLFLSSVSLSSLNFLRDNALLLANQALTRH
jgi:hypothetical protein